MEIRVCRATSPDSVDELLPVEMYVVQSRGTVSPKKGRRLEPTPFTSFPIRSCEAALEVNGFLELRWRREGLFHVLKSVCRLTELQLGSLVRLQRVSMMLCGHREAVCTGYPAWSRADGLHRRGCA